MDKAKKTRCDLCLAWVWDSQVIPMAAGSEYRRVCHHCLINGWISYCLGCYHTFPASDLNKDFLCEKCRTP